MIIENHVMLKKEMKMAKTKKNESYGKGKKHVSGKIICSFGKKEMKRLVHSFISIF